MKHLKYFPREYIMKYYKIKKDIVIFIDAVDQLTHPDSFIWLPSNLPKNIKIIISALKDEKYSMSSQYYISLQKKTENCIKIDDFKQPLNLLNKLLKKEKERAFRNIRKTIFLIQYNKVRSPLYIMVAMQELKHWKSYDSVDEKTVIGGGRRQNLASSQQGIIEEYIENLSTFYHHDKEFVKKVLGYLYASKDGLSESELLKLISINENLVEHIAPSTWHENNIKELPIVIWTRLYAQLKPFLSSKIQEDVELLYFFHREFENVIMNFSNQMDEHKDLIVATEKNIFENQNLSFDLTRWGNLHIISLLEYHYRYKDVTTNNMSFNDITRLRNREWQKGYITKFNNVCSDYQLNNKTLYEKISLNILIEIVEKLYGIDPGFFCYTILLLSYLI